MRNVVSFLIAGAMFAAVAFSQTTDAGAAARLQAKTGRAAVAQSKAAKCCGMKKCCGADKCCGMKMCHMDESSAAVSHSDAEQRFFAKNGQYPPAAMGVQSASQVPSAGPAHDDAQQRLRAKTGRYEVASAGMQMDCCKRRS